MSTEAIRKLRQYAEENEKEEFDGITYLVLLEECINGLSGSEDQALFFDELYGLLDQFGTPLNDELLWGLPKALIKNISSKNVEDKALLKAICNCMKLVARVGTDDYNFLFGTELLRECRAEDTNIYDDSNDTYILEAFKVRVELLLEEFILPALKTLGQTNPSKFLSVIVSALVELISNNMQCGEEIEMSNILLDVIIRFYDSYELPSAKVTTPDGAMANKDEEDIVQKILESFWSFSIGRCIKNQSCFPEYILLSQIPRMDFVKQEIDVPDDFIIKSRNIIRITNEKLQLDLQKMMEACFEETRKIYKLLPPNPTMQDGNDLTEEIYQMSYVNGVTTLEEQKGKLSLDTAGVLTLSGLYYIANDNKLNVKINLYDAVLLYLRFSSASLYSPIFDNTFVEGICRFWLWSYTLGENRDKNTLQSELMSVPDYVLKVFFQLLLLKTCNEASTLQKRINFNLLTQLLAFSNAEVAFDFIVDTILSCPYLDAKIAIAGILKDLMAKKSDDIHLKEARQVKNEPNNHNCPPKLPDRPPITVDEHRIASIHSLVKLCIEDCLKPLNNKTQGNLILLQYYINILITLYKQWDGFLLKEINDEIKKLFSQRQEQEFPELEFIRLANDTLSTQLERLNL